MSEKSNELVFADSAEEKKFKGLRRFNLIMGFLHLIQGILMAYQQSLTAHLRFGVNNALAFAFTRNALSRPGIEKLFYGLESLDASWDVDGA